MIALDVANVRLGATPVTKEEAIRMAAANLALVGKRIDSLEFVRIRCRSLRASA